MDYDVTRCSNRKYKLLSNAQTTNRVLEYADYNSVENGETFDFEMSARAIDDNDKLCTVYWIFSDIKGEEEKSLDEFDYDECSYVVYD